MTDAKPVGTASGSRHRPFYDTPNVRRVLVLAAVVGVALGVETVVLHAMLDPLADVRAYYDAGARLNAGLPLYEQSATTDDAAFYRYPPLLAIAFRPLAALPYEAASVVWEVLVITATVLTVLRLGWHRKSVVFAVCCLALPIGWTVTIGQAQAIVTLLLAIASPAAVALAGNIKVFPVLAALFWVGRRDWRALAVFGAWTGALIGLQFLLEPQGTLAYASFLSLEQVGGVENRSLYALSPVLFYGSVAAMAIVALCLARTRYGWAAAVVLSVFATPRLLIYQVSTLVAGLARSDRGSEDATPNETRLAR